MSGPEILGLPDARIYSQAGGFSPFYLQFKRPSAYPRESRSKIVQDRVKYVPELATDPLTLFFGLRRKTPIQKFLQHNVLFRLHRRLQRYAYGDAVYVCPLFLNREAYRTHVHISALRAWGRFWARGPRFSDELGVHSADGNIRFEKVPLLAEHVCIPPHVEVTDAKHSYSFSDAGRDVCFHSPKYLPDGAGLLSNWLSDLSAQVIDSYPIIRTENAKSQLLEFLAGEEVESDGLPIPNSLDEVENGIAAWMEWGFFLRTEFDIHQFAFVRWRDDN